MATKKRLARRPDEGMLAGVAAGVAETYDIDPTLVRLAFVAVAIATGGIAVLLYLAAAVIMPRADESPGLESVRHNVDELITRGKQLYAETRRVIERPSRNGAAEPAGDRSAEEPTPPTSGTTTG